VREKRDREVNNEHLYSPTAENTIQYNGTEFGYDKAGATVQNVVLRNN